MNTANDVLLAHNIMPGDNPLLRAIKNVSAAEDYLITRDPRYFIQDVKALLKKRNQPIKDTIDILKQLLNS